MSLNATVISNLEAARKWRGVSIAQLADAAGVDRGYLSRLLRGHSSPTITMLEKLADALRVRPLDLLREDLTERLRERINRTEA